MVELLCDRNLRSHFGLGTRIGEDDGTAKMQQNSQGARAVHFMECRPSGSEAGRYS